MYKRAFMIHLRRNRGWLDFFFFFFLDKGVDFWNLGLKKKIIDHFVLQLM